MTNFVKYDTPEIWLPMRCDVAYFTWPTIPNVITEKALTRRTYIVHKIEKHSIPVDQFSLMYTLPGTNVVDSTLPGAENAPDGLVRYEVPVDPNDLDPAIRSAVDGKRFVPRAVRESNRLLLKDRESRGQAELLTENQRTLLHSLTTDPQRSTRIRVAIFDQELPGIDPTEGVGAVFELEPTWTWESVTSDEIRNGALNHFDVVVFAGGSGSQQSKSLRDEGQTVVREFVQKGGGYVGICAGAFLATNDHLGLVNAKAFTGDANIPGLGVVSRGYFGAATVKMELTNAGNRVFGESSQLLDADYSGGPILSASDESSSREYVPLALYRTEIWKYEFQKGKMVDTPAILAAKFGSGRVIIFSPHPEHNQKRLLAQAMLSVARKSIDYD